MSLEAVFVSPASAAPMESVTTAKLIKGVGVEGDRYALGSGTYSAKFLGEPGKNLTLVSADAVEAAVAASGLEPLGSLGDLRRNLVVRGLSADAVNDFVGHEIAVGSVRLFAHRRTVPCKYREAQCARPGLMNALWDACGVNCEILETGRVSVGDAVAVVPGTHDPKKADPGFKPPAFFTKPSERTLEEVKGQIIPPQVAFVMCLVDPTGFERVQSGYGAAGQQFWSPKAYRAGQLAQMVRVPLLVTAGAVLVGVAARIVRVVR